MTRPVRRSPLRGTLLAALLAGTALGGFALQGRLHAQDPAPGAIQPVGPSTRLPDFVSLVHQVKPAVVSITSKMRDPGEEDANGGGQGPQGMPGMGGGQSPFPFPFPFAQMQPQHPRVIEARGSGFIVDADGTVVTNNHVIKGAKTVTVTLDDGTTLPAKVVGHDSRTDLAVLKIDAHHRLPFINLGDSSTVEPGEWVVAVGNPFGLGGTVTAGIVSARGRDIGAGPYDSFIQIDAPINQGNSGGPLFTQDGKVVGVNSAIISPSGGSVGIGFAIPSNTVRSVIAQLEKSGHVTRGYIGVAAQPVSTAMASALHLPASSGEDHGALIASVENDSPAAHAGVEPGDVIGTVNGKPIGNPRDLALNIADVPPGSHASLGIVRNGAAQSVDVTVGTLPADAGTGHGAGGDAGTPSLGVSLAPISPELRQQLDLPDHVKGAVITAVQPGSAAEQAGLQNGDVITGVGDKIVGNPSEAASAIRTATKANQPIALRILRNGEPAFVAVTPGTAEGDQNQDQDGGDNGNG